MRTSAVGRIPTAVGVDARTRHVFVANMGSNTVSMPDAASGTVLATTVAPYPITLAVATTAGRVFAVSDHVTPDGAGRVSVLDAASGHLLRIVPVGQGEHVLAVHEGTDRVFVTNTADASVSLLDARSGRVLRTVPVGLSATALAVDARTGQAVVANSRERSLLVLDGHTASIVRRMLVEVTPGALAVDAHASHVFVANDSDASVSMVDVASGRVVRTVPLGLPPHALTVDQRRDRVVVLAREEFVPAAPAGQVQVLDRRTGRLLHTVAVGADATALALNERTGDAFVTTMNVYGLPAGSDNTHWLRAWLRRWLPWSWVSRLLPPAPVPTTGTVTMLALARLSP